MVTVQSLYPALAPYGFESTANICYGSWRNYAVSILPAQYSIFQLSFAVRADKQDKTLAKTLRNELRQQLGKGLSTVLNQGSAIQFAYRFDNKSPQEQQFVRVADAIAAALSAHGLSPACTCAVCGGGTPESLCVVNTYQPVHAACMRQKVETIREQAEDNKENGSYLTGLVGALLGALVGSLIPILVLIGTNTISAFLYALIPLAAMFGYRKFKGKSDKISIVIVVLISLLFVAFTDLIYVAYQFKEHLGWSLGNSISFVIRYFGELDNWFDTGVLTSDILKSLLFMGLGIVVSWGYLSKTGTAEVKTATTLMGTLRPNPMFAQDYSQEAEPVYGQEAESVYSQAEEAAPSQPRQTLYWNGQNKGE